jgi:hypothetical protein
MMNTYDERQLERLAAQAEQQRLSRRACLARLKKVHKRTRPKRHLKSAENEHRV